MIGSTDAPLASRHDSAREAEGLIDLLSRRADEARIALESQDLDLLEQILEEREAIVRRLEPLLQALQPKHSSTSAVDDSRRESSKSDLGLVVASSHRTRSSDALLRSTFESELARISRELDQMESDQAVRSAYGQNPRKRRQINLVR